MNDVDAFWFVLLKSNSHNANGKFKLELWIPTFHFIAVGMDDVDAFWFVLLKSNSHNANGKFKLELWIPTFHFIAVGMDDVDALWFVLLKSNSHNANVINLFKHVFPCLKSVDDFYFLFLHWKIAARNKNFTHG
jgi:hypothetical protein